MAEELKAISGVDKFVAAEVAAINGNRYADELKRVRELASVITCETNIAERKNAKAEINKIFNAIEGDRKGLAAKWKGALKPIEDALKEQAQVAKDAYDKINAEIAEVETAKKEKRRAEITGFYDEVTAGIPMELKAVLPISVIWDERWLNASASNKKIKEQMHEKVSGYVMQYETLRSNPSEYQSKGMDAFLRNLDFMGALKIINDLEENARYIREQEEKKRAEEEARRQREEMERQIREEAKRKAEEEARIRAEEARKAKEEAERQAELERVRLEAEAKVIAELEAKKAEEAEKHRIKIESLSFVEPEFPDLPSVEEEGEPFDIEEEGTPFGIVEFASVEDIFTENERWLVSKVFQNYYCCGINDIAEQDETAKSLFEKIGLI